MDHQIDDNRLQYCKRFFIFPSSCCVRKRYEAIKQYFLVDAPMGSGKTQALINHLKSCKEYYSKNGKRFLVCVNRISEEKRIQKDVRCSIPIDGRKSADIKRLVSEGKNICCTHSLFNSFDSETLNLFAHGEYKYDLYHDEQPEVFKGIIGSSAQNKAFEHPMIGSIGEYDLANLVREKILIPCYGQYFWNYDHEINDSPKSLYFALKELLKTAELYPFGTNAFNEEAPSSLLAFMRPRAFIAFENVWVLSYMIKGSVFENYLCLHGVTDYEYMHLEAGKFVKGYSKEYPKGLERLEVNSEKESYDIDFSISKSGYAKLSEKQLEELTHKFYNFMRSKKPNVKVSDYVYTTFTGYEKLSKFNKNISSKRFVACNIKAVNEYENATIVGYLIDRHINPVLVNFFEGKGIKVDRDLYSLSEMIQLVWRSNIRCDSDEKVYVYAPSNRMAKIFLDWVNASKNDALRNFQ